MNKIFLIIKREFIVRVKKKSFIIMTLLAPILMASLIIIPVLLSDTDQQKRLIGVYENNINNLSSDLKDSENIHFTVLDETEMDLFMNDPEQSNYYALLMIDSSKFTLYCSQQVGLNLRNSIKNQLEQIAERNKLKIAGINIEIIEQAKTNINIDGYPSGALYKAFGLTTQHKLKMHNAFHDSYSLFMVAKHLNL